MKIKAYFLLVFMSSVFVSCELLDELDTEGDIRDEITGEWTVDEDSELFDKKSTESIYTININKDNSDSTVVWATGLYQLSGRVKLVLDDVNIDIPDQNIGGYAIENGSGSISSNFKSITLYYYVDLGTGEKDIVRDDLTRIE